MLWHTIFNWNLPAYLSSRDSHELRENLVRTTLVDFFCYVGDGVIAGTVAKGLQNRWFKSKLETPIYKQGKTGYWFEKLPQPVSLPSIYDKLGTKARAYKVSRVVLWSSLVTSAAIMSGMVPLLNNWFTRKKVLAEEKQMHLGNAA